MTPLQQAEYQHPIAILQRRIVRHQHALEAIVSRFDTAECQMAHELQLMAKEALKEESYE